MALRENTTRIQFAGGIERKMGSQSVPTARLLGLEDAVFTKAVSLTKRDGYESLGQAVLGSATPYDLERGLAARGPELVLFAEGTSYSYVEGVSAWSEVADGVMSIRQSDRALVKTISNQSSGDYAESSGIAMVAWEDSRGGVYYAVMEADGGRVIIPSTLADVHGSRPRCVRSGDNLILLWADAGGQLFSIVVDPAQPHHAGPTNLVADDLVVALPNFDAVDSTNGTQSGAGLVWNAKGASLGFGLIRVAWLTPAGLVGSGVTGWATPLDIPTTGEPTAGPVIDVFSSGKDWAVVWGVGTASYSTVATSTPNTGAISQSYAYTTGSPGTFVSIGRMAVNARGDGSGAVSMDVWCEQRNSPVRKSYVSHSLVDNAGTWTAATRLYYRSCCLASSAWCDTPTGGTARGFVTLLHSTPLQSTYLTVRDDGLLVAQTLPGNAGDAPGHRLPRVTDTDGDRAYRYVGTYKTKLNALNNDVFTESGPRLVRLDFNAADAYQTVYVGRNLYLGSAITQMYDGVSWVETTPVYAPDWETTEAIAGEGSAPAGLTAGLRNYVFWYEATLATGDIIRGPVSKPLQVTTTAAPFAEVTIAVPTLTISAWGRVGSVREGLRVCAARTIDGDTATYYRITSLDPSTAGAANGYVANDQTADSVDILDDLSDADLILKEPIYTTGDIPSNDALGTSGIIFEGKNRIFVGSSSNANAVYFSQEQAEGYAAEFTPELSIVVPQTGGAVTGGVVLDDKVLLAKATAVYVVVGPGPLPNPAAGGEWSTPAGLPPGVGCVDQRTLAVYELGCVFKSKKGYWTIDRGGQASYIGAPVEAFNSLTPVRATTGETATDILFLHSDGVALHYNTLFGQWSTWKNHEGKDGVVVNGLYHYLRNDGRVFRVTPGVYADDNLPITTVIETAWVAPMEARQGYMRVWRAQVLGVWASAHTLSVQWMFDYDADDNWSAPATFDCTTMGGGNYGDGNYGDGDYGGSSPGRYQFEVFIGQICQAIRFRFSFVEAAGSFGACAELTELKLTFGVKADLNKLPAGQMG